MDKIHQSVVDVYTLMCRVNRTQVMEDQTPSYIGNRPLGDPTTLRAEIQKTLLDCREVLSAEISERAAYRMLFAFTVFFDEAVLAGGLAPSTGWASLQRELFDTDEGGQLFFDTLDEILAEEHNSLMYEVFYFCLKLGFQGKYTGQDKRIQVYKDKLSERFELPDPEPARDTRPTAKVFKLHSYHWYYAAAFSVNIVFWAAMRFA